MATVKKAVAKVAEKPVAVKTEEVKVVPVQKEEPKVEKKEVEKKPAAKKTTEKKPAVKKTTTTKRTTKKEVVARVAVQFADKNYTIEDFTNIAKDVWVYDFGKDVSELKDIALYVKPEENKVYYVFNDNIIGSFNI